MAASLVRIPFLRLASIALAALPLSCLAQPNMTVDTVTVLHDGRSVLINAHAVDGMGNPIDPDAYGAVDWVPGWSNSDHAILADTRGFSITLNTLIFTGAVVQVQSSTLTWQIYALIRDASNVVIPGDGLALTSDAGWLQDSAGNSLKSTSGHAVTNYSLVGTDGFIDESQFSFADTVYVDLQSGDDRSGSSNSVAWGYGTGSSGVTPLLTLSRAIQLWNDGDGSYAGSSCAIRVKRGTTGDEVVGTTNINRSGASLTSPLLISTYGSGDRPHITYPGTTGPWSGINRSGGGGSYARGDFVYINGLYLENTFAGDSQGSVGITMNDDADHFVVSDCVVKGFSNNITLQPLPLSQTHCKWWSIFRNIIVDAASEDNPQGLFAEGCQEGFLISQNVIDHNGYGFCQADDRNTFRHNLYLAADENTVGPFVWGNLVSRGGAFGCRSDAGGAIYGNLFAENALGCVIGGTEYRGGGRIARNYFEHAKDLKTYDDPCHSNTNSTDPRGWGPGFAGSFGPSIMELNCVTNSDGTGPLGPRVEQYVPNIIADPGFESGGFGGSDVWDISGDTPSIDTTDPHGDTHCALFGPDSPSGTTITQKEFIFTGDPINYGFWLKQSGGSTGSATLAIEGTTIRTVTIADTNGSWQFFHGTATVPSITNHPPHLTFQFHNDTGTWRLDDIRIYEIRQDFATQPEVLVRNNTTRATGPFAPYLWSDLFPIVIATRNCWDSTGSASGSDYAMWVNPTTAVNTLLQADYNDYYKTTNTSSILKNDNPGTAVTLSSWQSTYSGDQNSISTAPTYSNTGFDLASLAYALGWGSTADDYYNMVRSRQIGDNTPNLINFLGTTANMIGENEVGSPTISGGPMPFYGCGDGSDPQYP